MFKAVAPGKDGARVLMLGLNRENLTRLLAGKPIMITAPEMMTLGFPAMTVALLGGETEESILAEIESAGQQIVDPNRQRHSGGGGE